MFNIKEIANKIEVRNSKHRWQGGGQGCIAVICGFKRPADDDETGMWTHPQAGTYHDRRMPAVLDTVLMQHLVHMGDPDFVSTLHKFGVYLDLYVKRIELAFNNETDGHPALWENGSEIIDDIEKLQKKINALTFEG